MREPRERQRLEVDGSRSPLRRPHGGEVNVIVAARWAHATRRIAHTLLWIAIALSLARVGHAQGRVVIRSDGGPVDVSWVRPDNARVDTCTTPCDVVLPSGALVVWPSANHDTQHQLVVLLGDGGLALRVHTHSNVAGFFGGLMLVPSILLTIGGLVFLVVEGTCGGGIGCDRSLGIGIGAAVLAIGIGGDVGGALLLGIDTSPRIERVRATIRRPEFRFGLDAGGLRFVFGARF
jgi:hypothetical protein